MTDNRRRLPPLDYLLAFEAAALHGGFTAAGVHLNLSQAAVSRKIQLLEHHLGEPLFHRGRRSAVLTVAGKRYLGRVHTALNDIREATADFSEPDRTAQVNIAATQSVSTHWLMPRIGRLRASHTDVSIGLVSTDHDRECLESNADLIILRGEGDWPGFDAELLLEEEIFPVCSPDYARENQIDQIADLLRSTLIETDSHHNEWMNWAKWLRHFDAPGPDAAHPLTFNTFPLSIQAACDGLGVALGWRHLVDQQLASGSLVRPLHDSVKTGSGYYMLRPQTAPYTTLTAKIRDWLISSA